MAPPSSPYQPYAAQHKDPAGPGDARPDWRQVLKDAGQAADLKGKVILITGCSGGLGAETARALYETGAQLYLTARDIPKLNTVIDDIVHKAEAKNTPRPQTIELSLDSLSSVRKAAEDFKRRSKTLNILIENAGVMGVPLQQTEDGFERHFGTNHLGHFYLFQLLKPLLLQTAAAERSISRALILSSAGHRRCEVDLEDPNFENRDYYPLLGYCQSKTANLWTANEIDRRYKSQDLRAASIHPGVILTDIARNMTPEETDALGLDNPAVQKLMKNEAQGAATTVWTAVTPELESIGGFYCGDVGVCLPGISPLEAVYAPHAYSQEKEKKLYEVSCNMVGVSAE